MEQAAVSPTSPAPLGRCVDRLAVASRLALNPYQSEMNQLNEINRRKVLTNLLRWISACWKSRMLVPSAHEISQ